MEPSGALRALIERGFERPELAADPHWRLNTLYQIVTDDAKLIPFRMNEVQEQFYASIWYLNCILKARKQGFTSLICLLILDQCVFLNNITAGIVAHTIDDAGKIFRDRVLKPWESLPEAIRAANPLIKKTESELAWANGSSISVDTSFRGGTPQYLHISEFGKIARKRPDVADEIVRGSFESVAPGSFIFVESTAEGNGGAYHELCTHAQQLRDSRRPLTKIDFRFHFYGWWQKPSNTVEKPEAVPIPANIRKYLDKVEKKISRTLSPGQRAWYAIKHASPRMGDEGMFQEHPSTEEEPFLVASDGAYYAQQMAMLRKNGQITRVPLVPGIPVNTFWDWGLDDSTFIGFHQRLHGMDRFILDYENNGEAVEHYAKAMRDTGFPIWGRHYVPHDFAHRRPGLSQIETLEQMMHKAGITPTDVMERIDSKIVAINLAREVLPNCMFDQEECARLIECLDGYTKSWNPLHAVWRDQPQESPLNHGNDMFQCFAQASKLVKNFSAGTLGKKTAGKKRKSLPRGSWRTA